MFIEDLIIHKFAMVIMDPQQDIEEGTRSHHIDSGLKTVPHERIVMTENSDFTHIEEINGCIGELHGFSLSDPPKQLTSRSHCKLKLTFPETKDEIQHVTGSMGSVAISKSNMPHNDISAEIRNKLESESISVISECASTSMKITDSVLYDSTPAVLSNNQDQYIETPLSPSSSFMISYLRGNQSLVSVILLMYWDNILGPRVKHAWYLKNSSDITTRIILDVCTRTMSGEICRDVATHIIDYKFITIPDKKLLVTSFIFSANGLCGLGPHALSLLIPDAQRCAYFMKYDLIQRWCRRLSGKLKVLLMKESDSLVNEFSSHLSVFVDMLVSLETSGIPRTVDLSSTVFSPLHKMEEEFVRRSIASHLMTFRRSLVLGRNCDRMNLLLSTLALFNSEDERACSRYAVLNQAYAYHHELWLQGVIKNNDTQLGSLAKEILCSHYPTTLVDLPNREVYQSPTCQEHVMWHHETLKSDIISLYCEDEDDRTVIPNKMFTLTDFPETLVTLFLRELCQLHPACGVREAYISQFHRQLQAKAFTLIKYVEAESNKGAPNTKVNIKRLRHDLLLQLEGDFRIILSAAEKLKPGMYCFVMSD